MTNEDVAGLEFHTPPSFPGLPKAEPGNPVLPAAGLVILWPFAGRLPI